MDPPCAFAKALASCEPNWSNPWLCDCDCAVDCELPLLEKGV